MLFEVINIEELFYKDFMFKDNAKNLYLNAV